MIAVLLPNPAGGGLAGRNDYFENGSAIPRDRAYFYYSGASDFTAFQRKFDISQYTLGGEKTFFDGRASVELRLPMASTANSTQSIDSPVTGLDQYVIGNLGVLGKVALLRSDNFILSTGCGLSIPTARDTRVVADSGATLLRVENETVLVQPIIALAWAPTERLFVQGGIQFDFDMFGNPVDEADANNVLHKVGTFVDQGYMYLHAGMGYWVYLNPGSDHAVSGVSLLTELTFIKTMGQQSEIVTSDAIIAQLDNGIKDLNLTLGANLLLGDRASLSAGFVLPLGGSRQYDWGAQASFNWFFGRPH